MVTQLTPDDVRILNEEIASANPEFAERAKRKLIGYIKQPDSFANSTAEDWARKIYKRITTPGTQLVSSRRPNPNFIMQGD